MKKIIQICSLLSLIVVFSAIAASAQASGRYKAEIPFDFKVGQKSYQAGSYVIKVSKLSLNNVSLALEDKEKNILQTIFIRGSLNVSKDEPKLVFNRDGSQRFLSGMVMREMELSFPQPDEKRQLGRERARPEAEVQSLPAIAANK